MASRVKALQHIIDPNDAMVQRGPLARFHVQCLRKSFNGNSAELVPALTRPGLPQFD
jgi:hypothetical protein